MKPSHASEAPALVDLEVAAAWQKILPAGVCVSSGHGPAEVELTHAEWTSLGTAQESRVREFGAGRWHAHRAMRSIGFKATQLLRGQNGAPLWPAGCVGSISHTLHRGQIFAAAAVARQGEILALGIDVESLVPIEPRHWSTLLRPDELTLVLALPVAKRANEVMRLWCAKEAFVKASGIADRSGIEVLHHPASDEFSASFPAVDEGAGSGTVAGYKCTATIAFDRVFAAAVRFAQ